MSLLARAAKAVVSTVLAASMAEMATRAWLKRRGGYYRYAPHTRVRFSIDRSALPKLSPITRADINVDGERGGPPPREGERAYRALVVGGSAAECMLLDQDETWPAVVERILGEPDNLDALGVPRVHVGNIARAILPCASVDRLLHKTLPRYRRLDLILVMVGAADIVHWMERGMPREITDRAIDPSTLFEQHPEGPWGFSPRKSAIWSLASALRRRFARPIIQKTGGAWLHRVRAMRAAGTMIDEVPDATPMLDAFERQLTSLLHTARRGAARVVLVRQPWRDRIAPSEERQLWNFGLGRPYREVVTTYFTPRVVDALMRRIDARAVAVADRIGVQHVDLMDRLERSAETFYDYLHFTPRGAEAVGRVVAGAILDGAASARPARAAHFATPASAHGAPRRSPT